MTAFGACSHEGCEHEARYVTVDLAGVVRAWCYDHEADAVTGGPVQVQYDTTHRTRAQSLAIAVCSALEVVTWLTGSALALAAASCLVAFGLTVIGVEARWATYAVLAFVIAAPAALASWAGQHFLERSLTRRADAADT